MPPHKRRYLNLNQPALVFVKVIGLCMVILPAVLYGLLFVLSGSGTMRILLLNSIKVLFTVGALVFIIFLILMIAEQVQDRYFDAQYQKQRDQKLLLSNGNYECQYCGNQKVQENDKTCGVCGREFK